MMKVAVFSSKQYDERYLTKQNADVGHELTFFEAHLREQTAPLAAGFPAVVAFVNDDLSEPVIARLAEGGTRMIALRCAGFNNVDLAAAKHHAITVARVPAYSPDGVAEHAVALLQTLNRNIHRAYNRVRDGDFALNGLLGFNLAGKTVGVVGTGQIGACCANILLGYKCRVIAFDPYPNPKCRDAGVEYVDLDTLLTDSDIITLHCPLTPDTQHLINSKSLNKTRKGVFIVNTSRGALIDTRAAIDGLKSGHIGGLAIDVYEEEGELFFEDLSDSIIQDDVFMRLMTFPNVLVTGHQAFLTREALDAIAQTTLHNISCFANGQISGNEVPLPG